MIFLHTKFIMMIYGVRYKKIIKYIVDLNGGIKIEIKTMNKTQVLSNLLRMH